MSDEREWRVGRKVGRTLYLNDELVGVMDTPELAIAVVAALSAERALADQKRMVRNRNQVASRANKRQRAAEAALADREIRDRRLAQELSGIIGTLANLPVRAMEKLHACENDIARIAEVLLGDASLADVDTEWDELEKERDKAQAALADREKEIERLREALMPFVHPVATSRTGDGGATTPENDTMKVEVKAGDWLRGCVALGTMDGAYLRALRVGSRPSDAFLAALDDSKPAPDPVQAEVDSIDEAEMAAIVEFVKGWVSGWLEAGGKLEPDLAELAVRAWKRHQEFGGGELPAPYERRLREALGQQ